LKEGIANVSDKRMLERRLAEIGAN